ncbi:MAG: ATP-binding protein [Myxococcota bacterium]
MTDDAQTLLDRLVGQFSSPYDFLRELVQNAMDAGSDLVEVALHVHAGDVAGEVIYELEVIDAGVGMDEEIIDGQLTRLFGTSKTDDRTMAGGFGIGFVSVFAWSPERVLVQTGRQGDAWELVFFEDRRFEKHRVDMPLEGTTIRLFRRGTPAEREGIAEAIEDSLQRWCRFCPIEITFEDVESGEGPQAVSEPFTLEDVAASVTVQRGPTRCTMGFSANPSAVLMRRGLVLAEGACAELLPTLCKDAGTTVEHLDVRVDSPRLRTGLARDAVVDDADRHALERELEDVLADLRGTLAGRVEALAAKSAWGPDDARTYSHLHAHLRLEHHVRSLRLTERPVLRLATGGAVSLLGLHRRARLGVVAVADADELGDALELRLIALRSSIPVVHGRWALDARWLPSLLEQVGLRVQPLASLVSRLEPAPSDAQAVGALAVSMLEGSA